MKILVCDPISDKAIEELKTLGHSVEVKTGMSPDELKSTVSGYECMIVRSATKVRQEIIDAAPGLKLIIRGGVGIDNIDVEYAKSKGIQVRNTPAASSISVAELTIAHMLSLIRHIPRGTQTLKAGEWEKKRLKGTELYQKTLGLIGIGRIGREVAKRAICLGMNVIVYDPYIKEIEGLNVKFVSFEELIKTADFITIHTPLTEETRHILSDKEFEKMKEGVYIINCARGGIVDEDALYRALTSGKVAGAALDVFEKEPPEGNRLLRLDNFICTPHLGASTKEAQERIGGEIIRIINEK